VGPWFQPDADATSLYFASESCTSADHKAAAVASLREHAISAPHDHFTRVLAAAQEGASQ
jgi:hypothetical protein